MKAKEQMTSFWTVRAFADMRDEAIHFGSGYEET
jgi:hypothetical protein